MRKHKEIRNSKKPNEKVRIYRKRRGLTLDELARRCNLTKGYLSKLEIYCQPEVDQLDRLPIFNSTPLAGKSYAEN